MNVQLVHLYLSRGHDYRGHHGQAAGSHAVEEQPALECVAGRGIRGDRYFDYQEDFKGQITFFAEEVYHALRQALGVWDKAPSAFRRNVITRGVELNDLIGQVFEVQGVRFLGVESCKPCHWMDAAFGPGAEAALEGRGGLRARILTDGVLRVTAVAEAK